VAPRPPPRPLWRRRRPHEARDIETCEFHLKLRLFGSRMSMENLENDRRPIVNIHTRCFSNGANLCRREFVIENDVADFRKRFHEPTQFFKFSRPNE
jgi:hypothetical protein